VTALIQNEKALQFLVDLAEQRISKKDLRNRIESSGISQDDGLERIAGVTHPFPAWLLDSAEAARMVLAQYHLRKQGRLPVPPILDAFVTDAMGRILGGAEPDQALHLRRPRSRSQDRRKAHATETLRRLIELEMQYIRTDPLLSHEQKGRAYITALERIADSHGMSPSTLDQRLHPRDRKQERRSEQIAGKTKNPK